MKLGFSTMNNPDEARPDVLAKALEDRGFDSLFIGEHSHIPVARTTPYPSGGDMPVTYKQMMDPFVSLMAAASATTSLLLGTGVCLCLEHDLFDLAKTVSTLDLLSGGRVLFGVGVGWNVEELANHRPGLPWGKRYTALAECIAALKALWTQNDAEFHGDYFSFDPVWSYPKPARSPHPPILCGTGGRLGTKHAVQWADEWMPMDVALGDVGRKIGKFRQIAADAGRGEIPITIVAMGKPTVETLEQYQALGVVRVLVGATGTPWKDQAEMMTYLDHYGQYVDRLR